MTGRLIADGGLLFPSGIKAVQAARVSTGENGLRAAGDGCEREGLRRGYSGASFEHNLARSIDGREHIGAEVFCA